MKLPSSIRERLWWFDVVYPAALGILLFTSLTFVVYAGQPQFRLSIAAERKLREIALRQAKGRPVRDESGVVVVSADPLDVTKYGRAPFGPVPDPSAAAYARVLAKLANDGVSQVWIHWDGEAHAADETYYLPLIDVLRRAGRSTSVYIMVSSEAVSKIPEELRSLVTIVNDEACIELTEVQTDCSFLPEYSEWMVHNILKAVGGDLAASKDQPWISTELSFSFPSYIVDLNPPDALPTWHFRDLLGSSPPSLSRYKVAFVGNDQGGAISGSHGSTIARRVLTVYDPPGTNAEVAGEALHVFAAQLAQTYMDRAMIVVPSKAAIIGVTGAFCALIVAVMLLFGEPAALGMFLVYTISGPYVNAFAIRHLHIYLPLFDSYYFGLSTILVAGMVRLSMTAFQRWRLEAQRRLHAHVADLKGNFTSLLSHNLNTPVAKMQGMLGILAARPEAGPVSTDLHLADAHVAQLEYCIRAVLMAAALREGTLNESPRNAGAIRQEFISAMGASLRRLGLDLTVNEPTADEEDLLLVPLHFDLRALTAAIASAAALFASPGKKTDLAISFHVTATDLPTLVVTFSSKDAKIPDAATDALPRGAGELRRGIIGPSFLVHVLADLARLTAQVYSGTLSVDPERASYRLTMAFGSRSGGM